jgi:hypothetical protein
MKWNTSSSSFLNARLAARPPPEDDDEASSVLILNIWNKNKFIETRNELDAALFTGWKMFSWVNIKKC